jgi:CxxC motif-containing protein (DUF1111 family)
MKRPNSTWLVVVLVGALVPVGLRMLTWRNPRLEIDQAMASAGEVLFNHVWKQDDPLAHEGDGLGPVFNAKSCVACHHQGGVGGAGGLGNNVTVFTVRNADGSGEPREGVIHAAATKSEFKETMKLVSKELPAISQPSLTQLAVNTEENSCGQPRQSASSLRIPASVHFSQRNTPALFGVKLIDEIPDREIIAQERRESLRAGLASSQDENAPVGRASRLADGRIGKFGWKAQIASLSDFVQAACANELGLGNPGQAQPTSLARPSYQPRGLDLSLEQCDQLTQFVASLPRPVERRPVDSSEGDQIKAGKELFMSSGCASCHTPSLGSVDGLYSDLLLHIMGRDLQAIGGGYNDPHGPPPPDVPRTDDPLAREWRTPPLWGVADSAPYLHDGRAVTLHDAIRLHGGQGAESRDRYLKLSQDERSKLIAFLNTLHAPAAEKERRGDTKLASAQPAPHRF